MVARGVTSHGRQGARVDTAAAWDWQMGTHGRPCWNTLEDISEVYIWYLCICICVFVFVKRGTRVAASLMLHQPGTGRLKYRSGHAGTHWKTLHLTIWHFRNNLTFQKTIWHLDTISNVININSKMLTSQAFGMLWFQIKAPGQCLVNISLYGHMGRSVWRSEGSFGGWMGPLGYTYLPKGE